MTVRDDVEIKLTALFPDFLRKLDETCIPTINAYKRGNFAFSYMGLSLYCNGHNALSKSTYYPRGLLYKDDDAIFGVGVFFRSLDPQTPCVNIVAPRGKNWLSAVNQFALKVQQYVPGAKVFVRDLSFDQYITLKPQSNLERVFGKRIDALWTAIEADPWIKKADVLEEKNVNGEYYTTVNGNALRTPRKAEIWATQEDATFNSGLIDLQQVMRQPANGMFNNISWLPSNERSKRRLNYNAFQHFLDRHGLEYILEEYKHMPEMRKNARELVKSHFLSLEKKEGAIGSTAADYENIIACDPDSLKEAGLHMYMGFIRKKDTSSGLKIPVSFFGLENIHGDDAEKMVASYATITSYDESRLLPLVQLSEDDKLHSPELLPVIYMEEEKKQQHLALMHGEDRARYDRIKDAFKGVHNIAIYATGQLMHEMKENHGIRWFHMGGSETRNLEWGKRRLGAKEDTTFWAVTQKSSNGRAQA